MAKHNPRRTNSHRRNQLRKQVLASETHCALCGLPVDKTLPPGQPGSPEVDEIIPVSKGGSPYQRTNTQLTHRICNQKKSNNVTPTPPPNPNTHNKPNKQRTNLPW